MARIPSNTMLWLSVDDVVQARADLLAAGVGATYEDVSGPAVTEILDQPWGRDFALRDPEGNCVHFTQ